MEDKDLQGRTPAQERADIGTPAGENPENGRKRHGTQALTSEGEEIAELRRRGYIESEDDISDEDFNESGDEISVTGGLTGTKIKGGIPPGGTQSGGTLGPSQGTEPWEERH